MPNLTSVGVASGVPNSGTGTVSTIDALMALVGEVQASPTALTLLDRLKTIATAVAAATPAGTNLIGATSPAAAATGGASMHNLPASAATTNATSVKGSAGTVYGIQAFNTSGATKFLKLYNKASAPTV